VNSAVVLNDMFIFGYGERSFDEEPKVTGIVSVARELK